MNATAQPPTAEELSTVYFDYALQVWVTHGKVEPCEHPLDVRQAAWREGRHCCAQHKLAGLRALDVPGHESPLMVTHDQAERIELLLAEYNEQDAREFACEIAHEQLLSAPTHG